MGDISAFLSEYRGKYPQGEVRLTEKMSAHTTFRVGGTVSWMFVPKSFEETAFIAEGLKNAGVRTIVMGNGSNLLVSDGHIDMAVIKIADGLSEVRCENGVITAGAGALLARVSAAARDNGLTGFEFACGIPGSVGGAVCMNAGAYGGEIKDVLKSVTVLDENFNLKKYSADECDLSYRHSRFEKGGEIVLSAEFVLQPGDKSEISAAMDDLLKRRREKQPVELPSAGSTFKRPKEGFAAAMIEQAGLKGLTVGGAQVSKKHSGFVVNIGGATFEDVTTLMEEIQKKVYEAFGVMLEPEVRVIR